MERKFESELGKRIMEGNRRKSSKNVMLVVATVGVMALLIGAASFTIARMATAGNSPVVSETYLFGGPDVEPVEDIILVSPDSEDTAAKRVMNLKYRSVDPQSDIVDLGKTKFTYMVNIYFKATVDGIGSGTAVGNLEIVFDAPIDDSKVLIEETATIVCEPLGVSVDSTDVLADENTALDKIDVTAAIPTTALILGADYSVSIKIEITIMDSPGLTGALTEQPWPTLNWDETVVDENGDPVLDENGNEVTETVYEFNARSASFPAA